MLNEKKWDNPVISGNFICDLKVRQNDYYLWFYLFQALFRYLDQKTGMKEGTTNLTTAALIFDTLIMEVKSFFTFFGFTPSNISVGRVFNITFVCL